MIFPPFWSAEETGSASYWRVSITDNNGSASFTGFGEFILAESIGGSGVQSEGTPSADGFAEGSSNLQRGNNGLTNDAWLWNFGDVGAHWYQIRFASNRTIVEFGFTSCTNTAIQPVNQMPKNFKLQKSTDGSSWVDVISPSAQTGWSAGETRRFS